MLSLSSVEVAIVYPFLDEVCNYQTSEKMRFKANLRAQIQQKCVNCGKSVENTSHF